MVIKCNHKDFIASVNVIRLEDINRYNAEIKIHCKDCGVPMRFVGLPPGLDLNGASVSLDRLEARLSIHPQNEDVPGIKGVQGFSIRIP